MLHHMTDATQARALAEMMRVLKPGGRCFVAEMFRDGQSETQMTDVLIHHWIAAVETAIIQVAHPKAVRWVHRETFPRSQIVGIVESSGLRSAGRPHHASNAPLTRAPAAAIMQWQKSRNSAKRGTP